MKGSGHCYSFKNNITFFYNCRYLENFSWRIRWSRILFWKGTGITWTAEVWVWKWRGLSEYCLLILFDFKGVLRCHCCSDAKMSKSYGWNMASSRETGSWGRGHKGPSQMNSESNDTEALLGLPVLHPFFWEEERPSTKIADRTLIWNEGGHEPLPNTQARGGYTAVWGRAVCGISAPQSVDEGGISTACTGTSRWLWHLTFRASTLDTFTCQPLFLAPFWLLWF